MRRIVFPSSRNVVVEHFDGRPLRGKDVLVRSEFSLLSNGTERTIFQRKFDSGTHWDLWVRYPFYPGYASVGSVIDLGPEVPPANLGRRVAVRGPHSSHHVIDLGDCLSIPDGVSFQDAVWFALSKVGCLATIAAGIKQGDSVLVVGGGPVGQMLTRWAVLSGSSNVGVMANDCLHLTAARAGGAGAVFQGHTGDFSPSSIERALGSLPDIIFDCTDSEDTLGWALRAVTRYGSIVLVGDPGSPDRRRLTSDILLKGITVIGIHDHNTYGRWTARQLSQRFFEKLLSSTICLDGICTHTVSPDEAPAAYSLLDRRQAGVLGIRFDWRGDF
jgi:2-desacetyl-2-hydroxyethyl bacteriochlorophyllide A dehydrogenase